MATATKQEYKVLVRSRYREVLVKTGTDYSENAKGEIVETNVFRKFHEYLAYMPPEEAKFLVESRENQAHIDGGQQPPYFYPAGQAFPVPIGKDEPPLPAPLTQDTLSIADGRQAEAARQKGERAKKVVADKKKAATA